jgi:hypothetical protein
MTDQFKPGNVDIKKLHLYSDDGTRGYPLNEQCKHIDIYESILSPVIYAEFIIMDSIDLLRNFPLLGEEYIEIEFALPKSNTITSYKLHVKRIQSLIVNDQQNIKKYKISAVSEELLEDVKIRVDRKFVSEISGSIPKIVTEYLKSKKKLVVEPTRGIDDVLVNKLTPFKAIDMLRRRAISKSHQSSSYVFFENKYGYTFATLEYLFDSNKVKTGDKVFFFDSNVSESELTNKYRNIIAYRQISFADSVDKIQHGGLNTKVGVLDMVTGGYKIVNYTNNLGQDGFAKIDSGTVNQNTSRFENTHGKTTAVTMLVPFDSSRNESFLPEKQSILQAYVQKLTQNIVHIFIWGDDQITAGDVIRCNFPEAVGTTGDVRVDRLSSGNFLVAKVRHIIELGAKPLYTQSLELLKPGMGDQL